MTTHLEQRLTNADLECLPQDSNRYELIEGELYVSTAPGILHQRTVGNIYFAFRGFLLQNPVGEIIYGPGVIFDDHNGVIPDLVFLSNRRSEEVANSDRIYGAPSLVVEVGSPGMRNRERDRELKLKLYRDFGVEEYWIVDPHSSCIEVYRGSNELNLFATLSGEDRIEAPLLPGFAPTVNSLFS